MSGCHPACVSATSSDVAEMITLDEGHDSGEPGCNS